MNLEQFKDIKNRAWSWYRGNMLDWALGALKNLPNAPKWVQEMFPNPSFDIFLSDKEFLKKYNNNIENLLEASQKRNFKVNYTKELLEYYEAERENNEYEKIDALCDMIIVAINAGLDYRGGVIEYLSIMEAISLPRFAPPKALSDMNIDYIVAMLRLKGYDPYLCLLETIKELESRTGAWNEKEGKWCKDIGAYTEPEGCEKISKAMIERYSSLDSVEYINEDADYWYFNCEIDDGYYIEDKVKKWYKADYSKCKLK